MKEYRLNTKLMGSAFELIVVHEDKKTAEEFLRQGVTEIKRIEDLLSEFKEKSITTAINNNAGIAPLSINKEIFLLLKRIQQISELSQGAFDITIGPLKQLYQFNNKKFSFPNKEKIKKTIEIIGHRKMILDDKDQSVFLSKKNMKISFAAIGKGYAADQVKKLWKNNGLHNGIISASGDLTTMGHRADGSLWKLGISNPDDKNEILFSIPVKEASVATSGDSEQHFIYQNTKYSHNINPETGLPVKGLKSISVFSPSAELSDALATVVYVKGVKKGMIFIEQLPKTNCIIIDANNRKFVSKAINLLHEN